MKQKWLLRWARWLVVAVLLVFLAAVAVISFAKVWAGEVQYLPFLIGAAIGPVVLIGRFWRHISTPLMNRGKAAYERGDYEHCRRLCQRLYKKDPTNVQNLCVWGQSLTYLARKQPGAADALFAEAHSKFQQALDLKPDDAYGWGGWGWLLHCQAQNSEGGNVDDLLEQAGQKFQQATKFQPDFAMAWAAWGRVLAQQAQRQTGPAAEALLHDADAKFLKAIYHQPEYAKAWHDWGRMAFDLAEFKQGPERMALLAQAEERLRHANFLRYGPPPEK